MAKRTPPTYPAAKRLAQALGQRLKGARLRRSMSQAVLAQRTGVTVPTIAKLEAGNPSTSLATLLRVLHVLGLSQHIDLLAADDEVGRALQDAQRQRAPRRRAVT